MRVLFVAESPPGLPGAGGFPAFRLPAPRLPLLLERLLRYRAPPGRGPLAGGLAENLFRLLGLDGGSRRENLDLFADAGFFLVDTVKCVFRKNRKSAIPADLIRLSAREVLAPEIAGLAPEYLVALGGTALAGLREVEPYASAFSGVGRITEAPVRDLFEEHHLLCVPYPGWRNRRYLDQIASGFAIIRDLL